MNFLVYDLHTGEISRRVVAPEDWARSFSSPGEGVIQGDSVDGYVEGGRFQAFPARPSVHHRWDWGSKSWVPNIESARAARRADVESERIRRLNAPIFYDGKRLDADQVARDNLSNKLSEVGERIRLGVPMAPDLMVWRDADNLSHSWPSIESYRDWLAGFAVAMSDRGTRLYACAWAHKDAINVIEDINTVLAYNVQSGWPE